MMKAARSVGGTLVHRTAEELKRSMLTGVYAPGDRLPAVEELAESFSVSRTVIREAIRMLAAKGLLDPRHGDGTYVRVPDIADVSESLSTLVHFGLGENRTLLIDLMELRKILESAATRLAAERARPQDLAAIGRALDEGRAAVRNNARDALVASDMEFHAAIAQASHNAMLPIMLGVIAPLLRDLRLIMARAPSQAQLSIRGHESLFQAIVSRDPEAAEQAALQHVERPRAELYQHLFGAVPAPPGAGGSDTAPDPP